MVVFGTAASHDITHGDYRGHDEAHPNHVAGDLASFIRRELGHNRIVLYARARCSPVELVCTRVCAPRSFQATQRNTRRVWISLLGPAGAPREAVST